MKYPLSSLTMAPRCLGKTIPTYVNTHIETIAGFLSRRLVRTESNKNPLGYKKRASRFPHISLVVLLLLVPLNATLLCATGEENKQWTFSFSNISIAEALDELSRTTGINIVSNQLSNNNAVSKRYKNQTIEEIVKDLFKGQNIGLVWHQGEAGIDSLDIWILDGESAKPGSFSRIERPVLRTPPLHSGRQIPSNVKKIAKEEEDESSETDEDESPETDEESQKEDVNDDDDSEKEAAPVKDGEPEETDDGAEEESSVSVKEPDSE